MKLAQRDERSLFTSFYTLVGVYVVFVSLQVSRIVFASNDDIFAAYSAYTNESLWESGFKTAFWTGRFYQIFIFPIWELPYRFVQDTDAIRLLRFIYTLIFLFFLFYFINKLLGRKLGTSFILLFSIISTFYGSYNPLNSFMFWYSGSLLLTILAALKLVQALQQPLLYRRHINQSIILHFFACLSYEVYLMIPLFYFSILLLRRNGIDESHYRIVRNYFFKLYVLLVVLYLVIYSAFKVNSDDSYEASNLGSLNVLKIAPSLFSLSSSYFLHRGIFEYSTWSYLISRTSLWIFVLIFFFFLLSIIYIRTYHRVETTISSVFDDSVNTPKQLHYLFIIGLLFTQAFVFNLPISLSSRYQSIGFQSEPYVSSLQSYFFMLIALTLVLQNLQLYSRRFRSKYRKFFSSLGIFLLIFVGTFVNLRNIDQFNVRSYYSNVWYVAENLIKDLNPGATSVASSSLASISRTEPYDYWSKRFSVIHNNEFRVVQTSSIQESLDSDDMVLEFFTKPCGIVGVLADSDTERLYVSTNCEHGKRLRMALIVDSKLLYVMIKPTFEIQIVPYDGLLTSLQVS